MHTHMLELVPLFRMLAFLLCLQSETLKNRHEESRLHRELSQLQSGTQASIERIRVETAEAYEREARLLRELRDQAQEDAARAKIAFKDLQVNDKAGGHMG